MCDSLYFTPRPRNQLVKFGESKFTTKTRRHKDPPGSRTCESSCLGVFVVKKMRYRSIGTCGLIRSTVQKSGKDFSKGRPFWSAQACLRLFGAGATPCEQRRQQALNLTRISSMHRAVRRQSSAGISFMTSFYIHTLRRSGRATATADRVPSWNSWQVFRWPRFRGRRGASVEPGLPQAQGGSAK